MAAVQQPICVYYKTGFCKFRDHCKNMHIEELCSDSACTGDNCLRRHPKMCRFYAFLGSCKFSDRCSYSHDNQLCKDVVVLRKELTELRQRLLNVESELAAVKEQKAYQTQNRPGTVDDKSLQQHQPKFKKQHLQQAQTSSFTQPKAQTFKPRTCGTCSLTYPTEEDFRRHDALQFCCDICGICFPSKNDVKVHEQEFHPGIPSANYSRMKTGLL